MLRKPVSTGAKSVIVCNFSISALYSLDGIQLFKRIVPFVVKKPLSVS